MVITRSGAPAAQVPVGAVDLDYFACEYPKVFGSFAFKLFQPSFTIQCQSCALLNRALYSHKT